jgi:hypothetical protein
MHHDAAHHHGGGHGLERCVACGRPFVEPVGLLDLVDEGVYVLVLHCRNCDRLSVGTHEDAEVEAYERRVSAHQAGLRADVEVLEMSRFIDEVDGFARALQADAVLPDDFGASSRRGSRP